MQCSRNEYPFGSKVFWLKLNSSENLLSYRFVKLLPLQTCTIFFDCLVVLEWLLLPIYFCICKTDPTTSRHFLLEDKLVRIKRIDFISSSFIHSKRKNRMNDIFPSPPWCVLDVVWVGLYVSSVVDIPIAIPHRSSCKIISSVKNQNPIYIISSYWNSYFNILTEESIKSNNFYILFSICIEKYFFFITSL